MAGAARGRSRFWGGWGRGEGPQRRGLLPALLSLHLFSLPLSLGTCLPISLSLGLISHLSVSAHLSSSLFSSRSHVLPSGILQWPLLFRSK